MPVLLLLVLSSSCQPPENKSVDDWATTTFLLKSASGNKVTSIASQSSINTVLISVVSDDYTLENNQSIPSEYYDQNLLNLTDYSVSLAVPLGSPIRLVQNVYSVTRTLDNITSNVSASSAFGMSDAFEVYSSAKKVTVQIDLTDGLLVTSVTPDESLTDVAVDSSISVTFNSEIDTSTISTNTEDTTCSGTIQVSDDDFSTCIQMSADPVAGANNQTFTVTPTSTLVAGTLHEVKIVDTVTDNNENSLEADFVSEFMTFGDANAKAITSFILEAANNGNLGVDITGIIDEEALTISLTIPYLASLSSLIASFVTTGSSVSISSVAQTNGSTSNDFTSSLIYQVTASNGTTQEYAVSVTVPALAHQAYLKAPNAYANDAFGISVAISGDTLVAGAYDEDSNTTTIINGDDLSATNIAGSSNGAAYVFVRNDSTWTHQAYLKAPNTSNGDWFGFYVAIDGDTIAVSATEELSDTTAIIHGSDLSATNVSAVKSGSVYVFVRDGTTWTHQAYLKAPNNSITSRARFGESIAIEGDTIVVGAKDEGSASTTIINGDDLSSTTATTNDSTNFNGAAYVFTRDGTTWTHQAYLKAPNHSNSDYFGKSVAISDDTIVVGAYGEGSSTTSIINGSDLSASDETLADAGAAYVFIRSGTTWSHQAYLKAPNTSANDKFGLSVAIDGDTAVAGAMEERSSTTAIINGADLSSTDDGGGSNGAAYVFVRNGTTWTHQAYLKAPNNSNTDRFGRLVAISGDTIVTGSLGEDSSTTSIILGSDLTATNDALSGSGAAYIFVRNGATWSHQAYLKAPNPAASTDFGHAMAIDGATVVIGSRFEKSNTTAIIHGSDLSATNIASSSVGAAYVFE